MSSSNATNAPSRNFNYDGNGNVTANGMSNFTYDAVNQLLTATADPGSKVLNNTYDANHHRAKAVITGAGPTRTTYSLYSAGSLLFEKDKETGEQRSHIFLNGQSIATLGSHNNVDADGDDILDYYERLQGLNPEDSTDRNGDEDGDGISNYQEYQLDGMAMSTDSDNDGVSDAWEYLYLDDIAVSDASTTDTDNDGVNNLLEYQYGTSPLDAQMNHPEQLYLVPVVQQLFF